MLKLYLQHLLQGICQDGTTFRTLPVHKGWLFTRERMGFAVE
jgi:hypothetical protein